MAQLNNIMEIFKLLDKSNCRKCNELTCLAFAAAVFQGRKPLNRCTHIDREIIDRFGEKIEGRKTMEQEQDEAIDHLDLCPALMPYRDEEIYLIDGDHCTPRGYEIIARAFVEWFQQLNWRELAGRRS